MKKRIALLASAMVLAASGVASASITVGPGNGNPQMAASATQFCRQCHFGEANEAFGITTVKTQF